MYLIGRTGVVALHVAWFDRESLGLPRALVENTLHALKVWGLNCRPPSAAMSYKNVQRDGKQSFYLWPRATGTPYLCPPYIS